MKQPEYTEDPEAQENLNGNEGAVQGSQGRYCTGREVTKVGETISSQNTLALPCCPSYTLRTSSLLQCLEDRH